MNIKISLKYAKYIINKNRFEGSYIRKNIFILYMNYLILKIE